MRILPSGVIDLIRAGTRLIHMKGILLAGGTGSRLWPSTIGVSKQLFPIYDKPLIFYPLSTLMLAGIRDILIITTPVDQPTFQKLLGDGSSLGIHLSYSVQEKPEGLAQSFLIGKEFIGNEPVALILGDNIFHGSGLGTQLENCTNPNGAHIFGYSVTDPQRYGVAELDSKGEVVSLEEKPLNPKSNLAIPGLYFFDNSVVAKAMKVQKSERGELEITSVIEMYLQEQKLTLSVLQRGTAWLDCGTINSLNDACNYIRAIEDRQGFKIGCIEEVAWRKEWISIEQLVALGDKYSRSEYGEYILRLAER
jgi:glucose-1-phosphate thymidylyltransferase